MGSSNFTKIHPPHSFNYKGPSTFGCEGRTAILSSRSQLLWHCPIPNLKRGKLASPTKAKNGNEMSTAIQRVSALERDLEIPAITAL